MLSNSNKVRNLIWFYWADVHSKDTSDGKHKTLSFLQNSVDSLKIKMQSEMVEDGRKQPVWPCGVYVTSLIIPLFLAGRAILSF